MTIRRWIVAAALAGAVSAHQGTEAAGGGKARPACGFSALEAFQGRKVLWEGGCKDGKADGKGALRAYPASGNASEGVMIFLGTLARGEAALGVIDTPDGFIAGEFKAGRVIDTDDQDVLARAFQAASEAADFVSQRFRAQGNEASAKFYAEKARVLTEQPGE